VTTFEISAQEILAIIFNICIMLALFIGGNNAVF